MAEVAQHISKSIQRSRYLFFNMDIEMQNQQDGARDTPPSGMWIYHTPKADEHAVAGGLVAPDAPRRRGGITGEDTSLEASYEHTGEVFEYVISFKDGYVTLKVRECDGCLKLSHRDWVEFYTCVAPEFGTIGWSEGPYVSQWVSDTGEAVYRIEAVRVPKTKWNFMCFGQCDDAALFLNHKDKYILDRRPNSDTIVTSNRWFETVFYIQWCDWNRIHGIFREIDLVAARYQRTQACAALKKQLFIPICGDELPSDNGDGECVAKL